ncbi:MAG TPA: WbqC family protein [Solirubrobacteraceae bacterium]|nr:WbqC family protein [Solirubrobacteraceae bacterium]
MVDRFVVFDHVQAPRGKSWLTRNRILVQGQAQWLTMPTHRSGTGLQPVAEVRVQWESPLVAKHLRTLQAEYGRHPHFDEVYAIVSDLYARQPPLIADFNAACFAAVLARLGLGTELVRSSELAARNPRLLELSGNELVVATCQAAGADEYVSGEGCLDFIDPPAFEAEGIAFWFQRYRHPEYPQKGASEFVAGLSALDAMFNCGFERTRELVGREARERVAARIGR